MSIQSEILPQQHHALEDKALLIKIEKLEAWMYMYRDGKLSPAQSVHAVDILSLINQATIEQSKFFNKQ